MDRREFLKTLAAGSAMVLLPNIATTEPIGVDLRFEIMAAYREAQQIHRGLKGNHAHGIEFKEVRNFIDFLARAAGDMELFPIRIRAEIFPAQNNRLNIL